MKKSVLKPLLLIIIFGVPVIWYLFLQLFGENKFELPVQKKNVLVDSCRVEGNSFYIFSLPGTVAEKNQFQRLKQYADSKGITISELQKECIADTASNDVYLIDRSNQLRGSYNYRISEIDRAKAEGDLLLKIQEDGAGN